MISGNLVYLTVPDNVAGQKLVPTISISEGAVAAIDGVTLEKGMAVDLLDAQNLVVTAEDGSTKTYAMLVKTGNPKMDALVYTVLATGLRAIAPRTSIFFPSCQLVEAIHVGSDHETGRGRALVAFFPRVWEGGVLEEEFGADITGLPATVTVQDLLQHASGWISDPEDPMFPGLSIRRIGA